MTLPDNIVRRRILVTDLSQQLKKQRDFLKWMSRRYGPIDADQAAAFTTGARLFDELRQDLLDGLFDAGEEDLFTPEAGQAARAEPAKPSFEDIQAELIRMRDDPRQVIRHSSTTRFIQHNGRID